MSAEDDDNLIRVDFRARRVLADGEEARDEPEAAAPHEEPTAATLADLDVTVADDPNAVKLGHFEELIEQGLVTLTLDARHRDVSVPAEFRGQLQLNLSFSHRFHLPDFEYDARGVRATLNFDEGDHLCVVPWEAVYVMASRPADRCDVFPDAFPDELVHVLDRLGDAEEP